MISPANRLPPDVRTPLGPSVVVIADDDADIRSLVEVAVRRAGATVGAAVADGVEALRVISQLKPDLAVLDVAMPELTGLQVCRCVRDDATLAGVKLMLLSAAVHPAAIAEGVAAGADVYVQKPFSPRTLATQIGDLVNLGLRVR